MAEATKKQQGALMKSFGAFLRRFHLLAFFILIVGCLAAAVVLINKTLTEEPTEPYTSTINAGTIDQATLQRIQSLHTSAEQNPAPQLPPGRINPFAE